MATFTQAGRSMSVITPLGPDAMLLLGFSGHEGLSELFRFELDLAVEDVALVAFDSVLGRRVTIRLALPDGGVRYFSGICARLTQGLRSVESTAFRMEVVPAAWLLTHRAQSRIFQNRTVPDILKEVLVEVPDVRFDLGGTYPPRNYCVQYRETDFNFASRLMEEEGISYYFLHRADAHEMVITDRGALPPLAPFNLVLQPIEDSMVDEARISHWEKAQGLRAGQVTLRDHTFELPHQPLESLVRLPDGVMVGRVEHRLRVGESDTLEIYDWPGEYAQRFDGLDRAGGDRPGELAKVAPDGRRTAELRVQREAVEAIEIRGAGSYRHFVSGHTFALSERMPDSYFGAASHDGRYYLTRVSHAGRVGDTYRSGGSGQDLYENSFSCLPVDLTFRPPRSTPKPVIQGTQSAVVVGPTGEEIHTDKYGRVKVKFHWDRKGPGDDGASCWVRVAQIAAGGGFGGIHIPRVGQEVVVQFEEGDPDRPIVVGSVYNPQQMPPYGLPKGKMISGLRSNTYPGGGGMNEISVDDTKGNERMFLNAQYNQDTVVGNDQTAKVGRHRSETIGVNETVKVGQNRDETIGANETVKVGQNRDETIGQARKLTVGAGQTISVTGNSTQGVTGLQSEHAREIDLSADMKVTIRCGASTITLEPALITIQSPLVKINC